MTLAGSTTGFEWTRSLPGRRELRWIVALWAGAALMAGTAVYLSRRLEPPFPGWLESIAGPALAGAVWIVLTVGVVWAARRFPPVRMEQGVGLEWAAMIGHLTAALLVTFVLNAAFLLIREPALLGSLGPYLSDDLSDYLSDVLRLGLANLHFNFGAYWIITLAASLGPDILSIRRRLERSSTLKETLTVGAGRSRVRVGVSEIRWIEAAGDYVCLHLGDAEHLLAERLKHLEAKLDSRRFVRVHRSAIVNVDAVEKLRHLGHGDYEATMDDGSRVRISRSRRVEFQSVLARRELGGG